MAFIKSGRAAIKGNIGMFKRACRGQGLSAVTGLFRAGHFDA
jgi:hypothetical protein